MENLVTVKLELVKVKIDSTDNIEIIPHENFFKVSEDEKVNSFLKNIGLFYFSNLRLALEIALKNNNAKVTSFEMNLKEFLTEIKHYEKTVEMMNFIANNQNNIVNPEQTEINPHLVERINDLIEAIKTSNFWENQPKNKLLTEKIFLDRSLAPTPSSAINECVFKYLISPDYYRYKVTDEEFLFKLKTDKGDIDLILGETELPIKEQIVEVLGIHTYKILELLLTVCFKKIRSFSETVVMSSKDILATLGKLELRDKSHRRLTDEEKIYWLYEHIKIISRIKVFVGKYSTKGKKTISIRESYILNLAMDRISPIDEKGNLKPLEEFYIEFTLGLWMKFYNDPNGNYLNQFGYSHKEGLALNTKNHWGEKIYHGLGVIKTAQTRNNPKQGLKIRKIIEIIVEQSKLESILSEPNKSKKGIKTNDFKKELETALNTLTKFKEDPYHWEYKDPPSWLLNDEERKPRGWFDIWLEQVIVIQKPLCLTAVASEAKQLKPVEEKKEKITVEDLTLAMTENKVTLRPLAKIYGVSFSWLQRRLKTGSFTQTELKDLIAQCNVLGKRKK